jgi:hypothetical protein
MYKIEQTAHSSYGKVQRMAKKEKEDVPEYIPISPTTLVCPECHAQPGKACGISCGNQHEFVHVARIQEAGKLNRMNNARPN